MKRIALLALCCCMLLSASAQYANNANKVWAFGYGAGLDFTSGTPVTFTSNMASNEGAATVCNSSGSLLFYTDGNTVYNRLGIIMPGGAAVVPYPTPSSTQGALIMPFINDPNKYYLFSVEQRETGGGQLAYSIIDMSLDGGMGDVVPGSSGIMMSSGMSEKMILIPGNACNAWLMVHKKDAPEFYAYEVTTSGVSTSPVISAIGTFTGTNGYAVGAIKCSPNKQKIACASYAYGTNYGLELYDFSPTTGIVSNCQVLESGTPHYGVEFSPDNTKMYAGNSPIYQWDVTLPTTTAIIASKTAISPSAGIATDLRLAPDGRIYICKGGGMMLDRINSPNAAGTACGFVANAVNLFPNICRNTFPNLVWNVRTVDGSSSVCVGGSTTFTASVGGGTWSSTDPAVATISPTGVVTGVAPGTSIISYATGTGCDGSLMVTVVASPTLTGVPVCVGNVTALSASTGTGTWTSGSTGIATVGLSTGIVTGMSAGTASITYNRPGCPATTTVVTVNTLSFTGPSAVCTGSTITMTSATPGGIWSSSSTISATVASSGVVSGVSVGTTLISYSTGSGCIATSLVTVNTTPAIIFSGMLCVGSAMTLSATTTGGTWSTGGSSIATIGLTTGILSGVAAGSVAVTYTSPLGCITTETMPVGSPIINGGGLCVGGSLTLSSATAGGTYLSSTPSVATVGVSSGIVTGIAPGTAVITYSLWPGCAGSTLITVYFAPPPVNINLCVGASDTLTAGTTGGTWSSSNTAVATVGSLSGIITAATAGTATISYINAGQCLEVTYVTVNPLPAAIAGTSTVAIGSSITLTNATTGGTWSSSDITKATVSSTGKVTGVALGTTTIYYTLPTGCKVSVVINVVKSTSVIGMPVVSKPTLYPNPATNEITIQVERSAFNSFSIYNAVGQLLATHENNTSEVKVDVKAYPPGEYQVIFLGSGSREMTRFIKR